MGDKDIISKTLLKHLVRDLATQLMGLAVADVELLETQQQRIEERRNDLLARITPPDGETFLLHIEIQNDNQALMPYRMLRYLSDILLDHPGVPVRQYLVYIGRARLTMADGFALPDFRYRYRIIDMHEVACDDLLGRDSPDAWVLAILCDFGERLPREIVHDILTRLTERFGADPARLRDYVDMLDILAGNRDLNLDIREELKMLSIDVEKLATYQLGMERGMEQGMEKGIEKGAHNRDVAIAKNLLNMGLAPAQIVAATGLSLAEVEALAAKPANRNG